MESRPVTGDGPNPPPPDESVERIDPPDPLESVDLPDGRRLVVRTPTVGDRAGLVELYRRLPSEDLWFRFFTAAAPSPTFLDRWLHIADRGGLLVVALVEERSGRTTLVGEAGYSLLADGDGELGITVDPDWRGWLGPWLLAVLLREAAARGIPNLQAAVQVTNRPMIKMLQRQRPAVMEQDSYDEIRLVFATSGASPTWPASGERPRILVEAVSGRWTGEDAARAAGFDVRTCRGPSETRTCPLLEDGSCPLAEGADAVVVAMPPAAAVTRELIAAHREHPERQLIVPAFGSPGPDGCQTANEVVEGIRRTLGAR